MAERKAQIPIHDLLALAGLAMLGAGLWLVGPALALSVCGALLFALGLACSIGSALRKDR